MMEMFKALAYETGGRSYAGAFFSLSRIRPASGAACQQALLKIPLQMDSVFQKMDAQAGEKAGDNCAD